MLQFINGKLFTSNQFINKSCFKGQMSKKIIFDAVIKDTKRIILLNSNLKYYLLMYLKFYTKSYNYFKMFKNLKCNYDIIGDLMNINEADQTYFLISRTNTDNLMWFLLFSFFTAKSFHLHNEKISLHVIFKCNV